MRANLQSEQYTNEQVALAATYKAAWLSFAEAKFEQISGE